MSFPPRRMALVLPSALRGSYWIPLLREMTERTEALKVFTAEPGPLDPDSPRTNGLDIQVVGPTRWIGRDRANDYPRGVRLLSPSLPLHLWRMRPDVVITMAFSMWSILIGLGRRLRLWRMVILYDGSSPAVDHQDSPFRMALRRWLVRTADAVMSNSEAGRQYLALDLGAGPSAHASPFMVAAPAPVDAGAARPEDSERVLIAVGSLDRRKGIHLLLDALASTTAATLPPWRLLLIGDGPEKAALEQQARDLGIGDRVVFVGKVAHHELKTYFDRADAFVFPTLADTWGVVLLEAMSFGTACVASKWAGSAELIDEGVTGHVVDPRDAKALAQAIADVIADRAVATSMGEEARRRIAAHSPALAAERLVDVVEATLSRK